MWLSSVTKKELLEIFELQSFTGPMIVSQRENFDDLSVKSEYVLVWNKDPKKETILPVIIMVGGDRRNDFLAWAATYLPSIKPFTAYCRVLEWAEVPPELAGSEPSLQNLEESCLGLIFGEAASYNLARHSDVKDLSPAICCETYSFARARSLGFGLESQESLIDKWIQFRKLTKPDSDHDWVLLELIWSVLLEVAAPFKLSAPARLQRVESIRKISRDLIESVWVLKQSGILSYDDWVLVTRAFPELRMIFPEVRGTREERVRVLDVHLKTLEETAERDPLTAGFIAGYLTNLITPGTFEHAALLIPHLEKIPSSLIWYGLCAGMSKESQLKKYSHGLGRRVLRELLRRESVLERPRCDVALSELEVLRRAENSQFGEIRTNRRGCLEVEIVPRVNVVVEWPSSNDRKPSPNTSYSEQEIRGLVTDLGHALLKADNVRERLAHLLPDSKLSEFSPPRKKKR